MTTDLRIVSLLPAATEIVYALGGGAGLVGRSHECDFPVAAAALPVVSKPALDLEGRSQADIDAAVRDLMHRGDSLYVVDEVLLHELEPDVILTQDLCRVCAPSGNELTRVIRALSPPPDVVYLTPHTLREIDKTILAVGGAIGRVEEAHDLVACNQQRLEIVRTAHRNAGPPVRVSFLEWLDPPYCAGHWVPEMIEIAGGEDGLARPGEDSVRVSWDEIRAWAPELIIAAPCGYGAESAARLAESLPELHELHGTRVQPVDSSAYFARPGPRYVEGVELLASLIARVRPGAGSANAYSA